MSACLSSWDDEGSGFCLLRHRRAFGLTSPPKSPKMSPSCWRRAPATLAHSVPLSTVAAAATPSFGTDTQRASPAAPGKGFADGGTPPALLSLRFCPGDQAAPSWDVNTSEPSVILQSFPTSHTRAQKGKFASGLMRKSYDSARRTFGNVSGSPGTHCGG